MDTKWIIVRCPDCGLHVEVEHDALCRCKCGTIRRARSFYDDMNEASRALADKILGKKNDT